MTLTRFDIDTKGCMVPRPAGMLVLYDKHAAAAQQDEALIQQLVEALEYHRAQTRPIELTDEAITAGRARQEPMP